MPQGKRNKDRLFQDIVSTLRDMPDLLRKAFVLRHYDGLSEVEAAREIGVGEEEIGALLKRADTDFHRRLAALVASRGTQPGSEPQEVRDELPLAR